MKGNEPFRNSHFGPGSDAPEVMRVAQRQDAAAVLLRPGDPDLHCLMADHLAEAGLAIEAERGTAVEADLGMHIRLQPALTEGVGIARQHADPVRVVPGQVGLQQVLRDELDLCGLASEPAHHLADGCPQAVDWENEEVRHLGLCSSKGQAARHCLGRTDGTSFVQLHYFK